MRYRCYILVVAILVGLASCYDDTDDSTNPFTTVDWINTYGGSNNDAAFAIIETLDGNMVVHGYTGSVDGNITDKTLQENDYWLIKLNPNGELIWSKTYGGSGDDIGRNVIETLDGGFALVGYSMSADGDGSNNEGFHDNWLIKLDATGEIQWEKSYGFAGHDHSYAVLQTADGGYFMTGFLDVTASGGDGNSRRRHGVGEFWCHRLDANGDIIWRRYFGGTNNDRSFDAVQSDDGGFVITGFTESDDFDISSSRGSYDYWIIKLDASGNLVWEKSLGGSEIDQSRALVKTNDNGYIIAGNAFSQNGDIDQNIGNSDFFLAKINDNGETVWTKNYGGSDFDFASSITTSNKGYIVAGYSKSSDNQVSSNHGDNDFWVIEIDHNGNLINEKSFGGSGLDLAHDVLQLNDGSIVVVGETESNDQDINDNKGQKDFLVVKFN